MQFRIADTFTASLAKLPNEHQNARRNVGTAERPGPSWALLCGG